MSGISQEAQIALAELSKRKARDRLHRDGASSIPAMQRRIRRSRPKGYPAGRDRETDAQAYRHPGCHGIHGAAPRQR